NNFCEVMFNRRKYDALPDDIKVILKYAAHAASADGLWKEMHRMSQDLIELQQSKKVSAFITPRPILEAQLKAWSSVVKKRSAENPLFARVVESQKAWAKRVMYWHNTVQVDQKAGYAHHFGKGPLG
ncbi:MAG: C4-dicarboxylate ABC transporter, partial [Burkholderiales bacterium]|nr:C4-dicarboxylate ABC transporter [Burkholderiales bacterium]